MSRQVLYTVGGPQLINAPSIPGTVTTCQTVVPVAAAVEPASSAAVSVETSSKPKSSKKWLFIILGIALVGVIIAIVIWYFRRRKHNRATAQNVEEPYSDSELAELAQSNAEAAGGDISPVAAAAHAAVAGGGSPQDVEAAVLAAEQFKRSDFEKNIDIEEKLVSDGFLAPIGGIQPSLPTQDVQPIIVKPGAGCPPAVLPPLPPVIILPPVGPGVGSLGRYQHFPGKHLDRTGVVQQIPGVPVSACSELCAGNKNCKGFNYKHAGNICELLNTTHDAGNVALVQNPAVDYYARQGW